MKARCYKLEIKCYILVEDDNIIEEIITAPIIIYRGTEFNYESIQKLEELAIQRIQARRFRESE